MRFPMSHARVAALLLCGGLLSFAEPSRFIRRNPVQKNFSASSLVTLQNDFLTADFARDSLGRLVSLRYLGEELLTPFERTVWVGNPLMETSSSNVFGLRELLWGVRMTTLDLPVDSVERYGDNGLDLVASNYGNTPLKLTRHVSVAKEGCLLRYEVQLTNQGASPYSYSLWLNLIPRQPFHPIIPLADGLLKSFALGNNFHSADENWLAARLEKPAVVLALSWAHQELEPDGRFYSHGAPNFNTFEAILGKRTLAAGESGTHAYSLLILPGLPRLNALLDTIGIAVISADSGYRLLFSAAEPTPSRQMQLRLADGKETTLAIPALTPGKLWETTMQNRPQSIILEGKQECPFHY
ncbi:MAG: hypothetical protein IJJ33_17825 [Victivallales bacterium]|nr:hypothetical protein [Victivallales bacterium]